MDPIAPTPGDPPVAPAARRRRAPVALLHVALALAALGVTGTAFRAVLPWPDDAGLASKLAFWEAHRDDYDVLFLGSSRVAHGYDPALIDARLAAAGFPLKSFNLGVDAMTAFETDHLLRHVLAQHSERLRYVVIEAEDWVPPRSNNPRFDTERSVFWHDARQTWSALSAMVDVRVEAHYKIREALEHLRLFGKRELNIGRGVRHLGEVLAPAPPTFDADALRRSAGFEPYDPQDDEDLAKVHANFVARDAAQFPGKVAALAALRDDDQGALAAYDLDALLRQAALVEDAGCVPVYAMGPTIKPKPYLRPLAKAGLVPVLFDFSRPDVYPELYDVGERFDDDHLDARGAERFSGVFADAFAAWLRERDASR